jgi:NAD(P)-dependent dehydrogenase (short-subunit alcohol dehydrogenase family)
VSRRVVVTGGAKGIGLAIVERFAAVGDEVFALSHADLDVTDEDAVIATFARIGEVDVLVNNAGVAESAPLAKTTLQLWQRHFEVNATAPFLCTRAVLDGMRSRGAGSIITVASTAGVIGAPYTSAYTASKHAAVGLMRAVAAELDGTGVRANAVCPTFVRTEMTERTIANIVERTGRTPEEAEEALAEQTPLGRLLEPAEVADAVLFLASDAAAAITGQAIVMDGSEMQ